MARTSGLEDRAPAPAVAPRGAVEFIHALRFADLPGEVVHQAQRCLLDLVGVAAAGSHTRLAELAVGYAVDQLGGATLRARILLDGRRVGVAGAAFAGAATIDAFDAHDGHPLTKGHVGVAALPALLAFVDSGATPRGGRELLTSLVLGYELGTRAGIALHGSVADYHCSGAWNALAAAAIGARLLSLDAEATRHALGIAEYFGPRGQMLRVCDQPTMLKDGSGWGAHAGASAALLAQAGFTGAPAVTVEGAQAQALWRDLGVRWRIREQYFKPYPVCRWAQPAIEAVLELRREHRFALEEIAQLRIESFAEAVALGAQCPRPATTDEAQYSITYPVAAALVFGAMDASALEPAALADPRVGRLLGCTELVEAPELSRRFPAERLARVRITLADGRRLASGEQVARGSAENPLHDAELRDKFDALATPVVGRERAQRLQAQVAALADDAPAAGLLGELLRAP